MAPGSLVAACRSLALSTWLLSFCFVHLLCLDFTVAEREEWYTAFVNITYVDPATSELRTEKTECGRYGEHSPKRDAKGVVVLPAAPHHACDPNTRFAVPAQAGAWVALIARGNCTYKDKIRHAAAHNASAVVIFNVGSANANDTITMPHSGNWCTFIIIVVRSVTDVGLNWAGRYTRYIDIEKCCLLLVLKSVLQFCDAIL